MRESRADTVQATVLSIGLHVLQQLAFACPELCEILLTLPKRYLVRATRHVGITKLNRVILPEAYRADVPIAWAGEEATARTWEVVCRGWADLR